MKKGEMLGKMLVIATNAHANQFDKGDKPYILHPLTVMQYLNSDDEELQCIALGHDLFEDTNVTKTQLREEGFTERVINGIFNLTKIPGESYEEYKEGIFSNKDSMLVKLCDLRHNSDLRRLKGVTKKDIDRMANYQILFFEIQKKLEEINE